MLDGVIAAARGRECLPGDDPGSPEEQPDSPQKIWAGETHIDRLGVAPGGTAALEEALP